MREPVDLVVLDLMLPGLAGEAVLTAIRERGDTPVLIASAKRSDVERIAGPADGRRRLPRQAVQSARADGPGRGDPASEPGRRPVACRPDRRARRRQRRAAVVRWRSAGRRSGQPAVHARGATTADGPTEGRLTPGEIGLLAALARRPGAVLTRDQLLEAVTRRPDEVYDRVIDVHVANLRRKLGDDAARPWLIETIPQTGYRLVAAPDAA